jgi:signal transduction histidine kinase
LQIFSFFTPRLKETNMITQPELKGRTLQSRLFLLLFLILVPVLLSQTYSLYESYRSRQAAELQANLEIARAVSRAFDTFVEHVLDQGLSIGLAITSSRPMSSEDINRLLKTSRNNPAIRDFTWMNPAGVAIYSSNDAMIGMNYSDRSYYREVVDGPEWKVSELILAKTTGQPTFGISRVIRDSKGTLLGIVFAAILPERLDAVLSVERSGNAGVSLIDHKGMHVFRWPRTEYTWEQRNWLKHYPVIADVLAGKEIALIQTSELTGDKRIVGFTPVSSIGWVAAASRAEADVMAPILSALVQQAIFSLIILSLFVFAAFTYSRPIVASVRKLRDHALALGRGRTVTVEISSGPSEIKELSEAFDRMADEVRLREEALKRSRDELEHKVLERTAELEDVNMELTRSRHELRKLASELVLAEQRERKRIAGVLHDDIAQILAAIRIRLDLLPGMPADQKDKETLTEAKALLSQGIQETRALMNELGNPLLFDLGLKAACEALAERLMNTSPVRITCDIRDAHRNLDADMKIVLYQTVRELLNNVVKHSRAKNAHVLLDRENEHFRVKVSDDGAGFDPQALGAPTVEGGFGLYSIRERLIAMDGNIRIESSPKAGAVVTALLPASLD